MARKAPVGQLTSVAANAAAASRTLTIDCNTLAALGVVFSLARNAATAITMTARVRASKVGTWAKMPSLSISAGTGTLTDMTWTKAVSGNDSAALSLDCGPWADVELVFSATGGGANDLITVEVGGAQ